MTARRKLTTLDKLHVVVAQASCPLCGQRLGLLQDLDFHHETPLALGGADEVSNLVAVHRPCHLLRTTGRKGESKLSISGDGDVSKIAKVRRLAKAQEAFQARLLAPKDETPASEPRKGRKLPSKPFPKAKRKFGQ